MSQRVSNSTTRNDPGVIVTYGPTIAAVGGVLLGAYATYKAVQVQGQVEELKKQLAALQQQLTEMANQHKGTMMNHKHAIDGITNAVQTHEKSIKKLLKKTGGVTHTSSSHSSVMSGNVDLLGDIDTPSSAVVPKAQSHKRDISPQTNDVDQVISKFNN